MATLGRVNNDAVLECLCTLIAAWLSASQRSLDVHVWTGLQGSKKYKMH